MHACGAKRAGDRYGLANTALILCRALIANSNASFPGSGQTRFAEKAYGEKLQFRMIFTRAAKAEAIELRQNGKHSRRKSGATLRFRKCADDECAGFRHLIEIREQLDLIVIGT